MLCHQHGRAGGGRPACLPLVNSKLVVWPQRRFLTRGQWVAGMSLFLQLHGFMPHDMGAHPAQPAVTRMPTYLVPPTRDRKGPCLHGHPSGQRAQGQGCESDRPLA